MSKEEWIFQYKNLLRPWINNAPTVEELESYLETLANQAWNNTGELVDPIEASEATIISILTTKDL